MVAACGGGGGSAAPQAGTTGTTDTSTGSGQPQAAQPQPAAPSTNTGQESPASPTTPPAGGTPQTPQTPAPGSALPPDATQARFNQPLGLARDSSGNLYVADSANHTIRKIAPSGAVTTLAGTAGISGSNDGAGAAARFSALKGLAVDSGGNVYAVDNSAIRKISPLGVVTTLAGVAGELGDADGTGSAARFRRPWGIAVDAAGNVFVADTENVLVRRITPAGAVSTFAGTRGMRGRADGSAATATFLGPMGIAIDAGGNLYLTDWFGPPAPNIPEGSTFIRRIGADGAVSTMAGTLNGETGPGAFMDTFAITTDGSGNVFVAAMRSVRRVSATGVITAVATGTDFQSLNGIAMDGAGILYVTDVSSHTVSRVTQGGDVTLVAGKTGEPGTANTP
ncbi:hypothetical protein [Noviherbaspirillum sp. ST9]|uniref:hypothetical protein n=1 Tax=Noviherbaspirillum sp. ST9 TaxID=3401606 RepID=UPI003B586111